MAIQKKEQVKEIAVSFVRRIRLEEKTCTVCGQKFVGTKKSKYCGRVCQNKAFYERHADQLRRLRVKKYREERKIKALKK
jgi:ferredoxin